MRARSSSGVPCPRVRPLQYWLSSGRTLDDGSLPGDGVEEPLETGIPQGRKFHCPHYCFPYGQIPTVPAEPYYLGFSVSRSGAIFQQSLRNVVSSFRISLAEPRQN